MEISMRIVGHRKERPISLTASADLLLEGARFNDEIHRLPSGQQTFIRKGVYRFGNKAAAAECGFEAIVTTMASIAKGSA